MLVLRNLTKGERSDKTKILSSKRSEDVNASSCLDAGQRGEALKISELYCQVQITVLES